MALAYLRTSDGSLDAALSSAAERIGGSPLGVPHVTILSFGKSTPAWTTWQIECFDELAADVAALGSVPFEISHVTAFAPHAGWWPVVAEGCNPEVAVVQRLFRTRMTATGTAFNDDFACHPHATIFPAWSQDELAGLPHKLVHPFLVELDELVVARSMGELNEGDLIYRLSAS